MKSALRISSSSYIASLLATARTLQPYLPPGAVHLFCLIFSQNTHRPFEIGAGNDVIAPGTAQITLRLNKVQDSIIHLKANLDPQFIALFRHEKKTLRLNNCSG